MHLNTGTGSGTYKLQELVFQSPDNTYANATAIATIQSWVPSASQMAVTNISGVFADGEVVIGNTSGASYVVTTYDPLEVPAVKESYDNSLISSSASAILNTSETNPIGGL